MENIYQLRELFLEELNRGKGGEKIFPYPVSLEPTFKPFTYRTEERSFIQRLFPAENKKSHRVQKDPAGVHKLRFIRVIPSKEDKNSLDNAEQFILSLKGLHPTGFEVIGHNRKVSFQIVAEENQADIIISQLKAHFPRLKHT